MNPRNTWLYDTLISLANERGDKKTEGLYRMALQTSIGLLTDIAELGNDFTDLDEFRECLLGMADALDDDSQEKYSEE
jgi:hypothetical protein